MPSTLDTGWLEFTAADSGTWLNAVNALTSNNAYSNSNGTGSKQSWKDAGIPSIPSNAYDISIDLEIEAATDEGGGSNPAPNNVRISIDGGANYSAPKEILIDGAESTQVVGGDNWGLTLNPGTSFTNANFRVQVEELANPAVAVSSYDRIRVRISYNTYDFILPLTISIIQIDRREDGIYIHAE